jgi:hypothetical protein
VRDDDGPGPSTRAPALRADEICESYLGGHGATGLCAYGDSEGAGHLTVAASAQAISTGPASGSVRQLLQGDLQHSGTISRIHGGCNTAGLFAPFLNSRPPPLGVR